MRVCSPAVLWSLPTTSTCEDCSCCQLCILAVPPLPHLFSAFHLHPLFPLYYQDPIAFLGDVYLSDNFSDAAVAWNAWRKEVVAYAVRDKIVPALLQELRTHLTSTAIETVLTQVQDT